MNPNLTGTAESINPTAQSMTGSGPDGLSIGQGTKLAFAPSFEEAIKYVKSTPEFKKGNLILLPKVDSDGNDIVHSIDDLYMVDKAQYDQFANDNTDANGTIDASKHNAFLEGLGSRLKPGFVGSLTHGAMPTIGSLGGLGVGSLLGLGGANPGTVALGAMGGAGVGSGIGEYLNQQVGNKLYDTNEPTRWSDVGKQAALSAATEGLFRLAAPMATGLPENVRGVPIKPKVESLGESMARKLGKVETTPVGEEAINVSKLTRGNPIQEEAELASVNRPIKKVFEKAQNELEQAKGAVADPTNPSSLEFGDIHGPLSKQPALGAQGADELPVGAVADVDLAATGSMTNADLIAELKAEFPRQFADMTDAQILSRLNDPEFFSDILKSLSNRFQGGRASGLSFEDILGMKPRQLIMLREMAAKRGRGALISPETSASLEKLSGELGDLQAKMSRSMGKGRLKTGTENQPGFYDPRNYAQRGFELGASLMNATPLSPSQLLYERLSRTSSAPKGK